MDELKKRLTRELTQNIQVKVKHTDIWNLPIHSIKVEFETVRQTKMDVLMKMLLIAFREADFHDVGELSDVLLVEPIFIENLVQKMLHAGLVEQTDDRFKLTEKGINQLDTEIFVDQFEGMSENLLYSPCHKKLLVGSLGEKEDQPFNDYRFYDDFSNWEIDTIDRREIREHLQNVIPESETPNVQTVISEIHSIAPLAAEVAPCIEFHLYQQEEDLFYARVWNTLLNEWDEILETQINERERQNWREIYSR